MSLTPRDRKILLGLVPVALLLAVWFLVLAPQRSHVSALDDKLTTLETSRDDAVAKANMLRASKETYAQDYTTVVRLGKAIPQDLDMASLLVQLETAAKGTGIDFDSITAGARTSAPTATPTTGSGSPSSSGAGSSSTASSGSSSSSGSAAPPAAAGGQPAQSGAGQATEKANGAAATSNSANQAAGAAPAASGGAAAGQSATPGLDTVPLTFDFKGSYFELADFLHRVKRFVRVAGPKIEVRGRLMTIDGVTFNSDASTFPVISAQVNATVYLSPKSEGTTAGGTSAGPTTTPTSGATSAPATPTPAASSSNTGAAQ